MDFNIALVGLLLVVILGLFLLFAFLIRDINRGKYEVKNSILSKEAEDKFKNLYPEKTIDNLKSEIEKIADLLIAGEESNRYTEILRQKAKNDDRIQKIKDAIVDNVELVKYTDDNLKARIKYRDYDYIYTLILSFNTVTSGRVFLNKYFVFKSKIEEVANAS